MAETCTLSGIVRSPAGALLAGVTVTFRLVGPPGAYRTSDNDLVTRTEISATTNGSGVASVTVVRNDKLTPDSTAWHVVCLKAELKKTIYVDADTMDFVEAEDIATPEFPTVPAGWFSSTPFVTTSPSTKLSAEKVLTAGSNVTLTTTTNAVTIDVEVEGTAVTTITALRAALAAAEDNETIIVGNATFAITGTSLSSELDAGVTGAKLQLSEGTVLLYANTTLAAADRALFFGTRRNLSNFGAVPTTFANATTPIMTQNVLAWEVARATGHNSNGSSINTDGTAVTLAHLILSKKDNEGNYWFNDTLRLSGGQSLDCDKGVYLMFAGIAPLAGTTVGTASIVGATDVFTLANHKLAQLQRVRLSGLSGGAGLSNGVDYYVYVIDKDTFKLYVDLYGPNRYTFANPTTNGTATVVAMERFGLVVDRPNVGSNSNTTHDVSFGVVNVSYHATNNENFSGINFRCAQTSRIKQLNLSVAERGLVVPDASSSAHFGSLWIIGNNADQSYYATKGTPLLHISNSITLSFGTVSCVGAQGSVSDDFGGGDVMLRPAVIVDASSNYIHFASLACEYCTSGIRIQDSQFVVVGNLVGSGTSEAGSYLFGVRGDSYGNSALSLGIVQNITNLVDDRAATTIPTNVGTSARGYSQNKWINSLQTRRINADAAREIQVNNAQLTIYTSGAIACASPDGGQEVFSINPNADSTRPAGAGWWMHTSTDGLGIALNPSSNSGWVQICPHAGAGLYLSSPGVGVGAAILDTPGTGVLRVTTNGVTEGILRAANATLSGLPTSDPLVAGRLWNNGGVVMISAG